MLKNYLIIAYRNLLKQKLFSFITIFGLLLGMTCFLLILSYVQFEKSYDEFHVNAEKIFRVEKEKILNGEKERHILTGAPLAPILLHEFPQIRNATRFTSTLGCLVSTKNKEFVEKRFLFADNSVFDMFTFPLKIGNPKVALIEPF